MTLAQLDTAIAGTAQNPGAVDPFAGSFGNPPTQAQMQAFAAYVETLRTALVRWGAMGQVESSIGGADPV